jgi:hypothetical protein
MHPTADSIVTLEVLVLDKIHGQVLEELQDHTLMLAELGQLSVLLCAWLGNTVCLVLAVKTDAVLRDTLQEERHLAGCELLD